MRAAPGQLLYSLTLAVAGIVGVVVGLAGLGGPLVGAVAVGAGLAVAVAELGVLARLKVAASLVAGGAAVATVIVVADGLIELSLPGLVVGAALGLSCAAGARYAEHIIAVEGPHQRGAAVIARWLLPWREVVDVLSGQPRRTPARPSLPPFRGHRR